MNKEKQKTLFQKFKIKKPSNKCSYYMKGENNALLCHLEFENLSSDEEAIQKVKESSSTRSDMELIWIKRGKEFIWKKQEVIKK